MKAEGATEPRARPRLLFHFMTLASGDLSGRLLLALAWILLARRLGTAMLGVVEFSLGILAYFQLATHAGLDWTGMRRIAQGGDAGRTVRELWGLRLVLAGVGFLVLLLVARRLPQPGVAPLLASYGALLFCAAANLRWAFLAEERGRPVVSLSALAQLAFLAAILCLVHGPRDVHRLPWIQLSSEMIVVLGLAFLFVRSGRALVPEWSPARWRAALREALPIGGTQLVGQVLYNLDVVLLGLLGFLDRVGIYTAAYRVVLLLQVVPAAYFTAIFPALAREYDSPASRPASELARRTLHFMIAIVAPVSLTVFEGADWIVTTLYGAAFAGAGGVLRLLVWSFPIVAVRGLFRHLLITTHQEGAHFLLSLAAAALNLAMNLALIPRFHALGAAVATIASEALLLLLVVGRATRILGARALLSSTVGPLTASAGMVIALGAGPPSSPGLRLGGGLAVYLLALLACWRVWGWPR